MVTHLIQNLCFEGQVVQIGSVHIQGLVDAVERLLGIAHVKIAVGNSEVDGLIHVLAVGCIIGFYRFLILFLAFIHVSDQCVPRGIIWILDGLNF